MADEVVDRYCSLADQFGARVEAASDDAWSKPAPCEGWTAKDVIDHVTGSQRNIAKAITGEEPKVDAAGDPKQVWRESYAAMKAALAQPGALEKMAPGPMGEMPVSMLVGRFLATDVLVHTWDLSRAIGADETLDADAVKQAYSGLKPMDAMIRQPNVFGPRIDPSPGDDEQTEFLKFLGRAV
jgi:uncharacterized protein (TIGR03086 family)